MKKDAYYHRVMLDLLEYLETPSGKICLDLSRGEIPANVEFNEIFADEFIIAGYLVKIRRLLKND